jgi:hypothetical protein
MIVVTSLKQIWGESNISIYEIRKLDYQNIFGLPSSIGTGESFYPIFYHVYSIKKSGVYFFVN